MTNEPYEELIDGELFLRLAPDPRHELICARLHQRVRDVLSGNATSRLLPVRAQVKPMPGSVLRPDLALITTATGKVWFVAEVVSAEDHHPDTVTKKEIYEAARLPRLWMIDSRYDNLEVYHGSEHGLMLKGMFTGQSPVSEALLPGLRLVVAELFQA